jgi:hypothetical protein
VVQRSHPPAWYPDPDHPGRVRRWNGRAWTGDVRPIPDWLRTLRLSPGPVGRVPRTSRWLWATSAALFTLGAVLMLAIGATGDDADRIGDRVFARRANERCAQAATEVVDPNRRPLKGADEVARNERLADGWAQMVADLRRLPVAEADAPRVDSWLTAWDRWTSLGHDYADALRSRNEDDANAVAVRAQVPKLVINRFAVVNGIGACVFR